MGRMAAERCLVERKTGDEHGVESQTGRSKGAAQQLRHGRCVPGAGLQSGLRRGVSQRPGVRADCIDHGCEQPVPSVGRGAAGGLRCGAAPLLQPAGKGLYIRRSGPPERGTPLHRGNVPSRMHGCGRIVHSRPDWGRRGGGVRRGRGGIGRARTHLSCGGLPWRHLHRWLPGNDGADHESVFPAAGARAGAGPPVGRTERAGRAVRGGNAKKFSPGLGWRRGGSFQAMCPSGNGQTFLPHPWGLSLGAAEP